MSTPSDIILGLDVGTTAAKASLFSLEGDVRLTASHEYQLLIGQHRDARPDRSGRRAAAGHRTAHLGRLPCLGPGRGPQLLQRYGRLGADIR